MAYGEEGNLPLNEGCVATVKAAGTINGGRAVTFARLEAAAVGAVVHGVAETDATLGQPLAVRFSAEAQGISAAAIAEGAAITSSANGRWQTAAAGNFVFGRAITSTSAADQKFKMLITREGVLA